jgi:hypothetical protein
MSDTSTATGKVVVNRAMSLDGFIAGPGHAMDWIAGALAPDKIREQAAATGAMLIGRRTAEVGDRMRIRFSPPGLPRIDLEPVSSTRSGAVTILRFRVS